MRTSEQVDEAVMTSVKKRLKDAYDNVMFYASGTWTWSDYRPYQRANQELYARHVKIQETFAEEVTRARTVQDNIPQSRLAQYANYEYDEARELSYTPNGGEVIFHYPCRQSKKETLTEPWMLPEVEQLFVWLTYSRDFNLLRYRDLVEFEHKRTCAPTKDFHFHKVDPRFYETLERAPGKSRFTNSDGITRQADVKQQFIPPLLNLNSFEDMTVKMKIDLDAIRNIWQTGRADDATPPKKLQVFKSSFDNLFVNENPRPPNRSHHQEYFNSSNAPYRFNELQERAGDFRNLQNLAELLNKLRESKATRSYVTNSKSETTTPTRRLYSDVVQGLANSSPKTPDSPPLLGQSSSCRELPKTEEACSSQCIRNNRPPTPPSSCLRPEKNYGFAPQAKYGKSTNYGDGFSSSSSSSNATFVNNGNYQGYFGGGNATTSEYHPNEVHVNNSPASVYAGGLCPNSNFQYSTTPQNVYCSSYTNAGVYAPYGGARIFMQQKQYNSQQWMMHQYRTPSIYSVAHFPPQPYFLLPPQPPKQQRWMQPSHYVRAPAPPQTYHVGITPPHTPPQNWGAQNQNLYRTNSVCAPTNNQHQLYENSSGLDLRQKYKSRKINSQMNLAHTGGRSKSPEDLRANKFNKAYKRKTSVQPSDSVDFKYIIKNKESTVNVEQKTSSKDLESLPVTASTSDELERQAIDEYQSSNESFYKELERQAEEQYEEGSGNSFGPPDDELYFGGLELLLNFFSTPPRFAYVFCKVQLI